MTLDRVFEQVAPSVVALGSRFITHGGGEDDPDIPNVIGTGFIVDGRGLVVTAGHVARSLNREGSGPDGDHLACAMLYMHPEGTEGEGFRQHNPIVPIIRTWHVTGFQLPDGSRFYGEKAPDLALLQLAVRDLPALELSVERHEIRTGVSIAFVGFPLGSAALNLELDDAQPILLQTMPFLRHGVISSVHPFPCPVPHGFTIDAHSHGGASGSPIFLADSPRVIGMLYAAFEDKAVTYALPSGLLHRLLTQAEEQILDTPTLMEWLRAFPSMVRKRSRVWYRRESVD